MVLANCTDLETPAWDGDMWSIRECTFVEVWISGSYGGADCVDLRMERSTSGDPGKWYGSLKKY